MSILDQITDALFYTGSGKDKELDIKKLAGLLGFGLTASGAIDFGPQKPAIGYNKPVPKYDAVRRQVQNTYDPNRRPGSGGQRYFTPMEYVKQSDSLFGEDLEDYASNLETAETEADTLAKGLETLNKENLASYPAPVTTTPEETNTGIASLPSIPTAEQQLAGQVNLGMANGGIVGLKKGTFSNFISNLGSGIKDTASNIGSELKDLGKGVYEDVTNWRDAFNPAPNFSTPNHVSSEIDTPEKAAAYVEEAGGNPDYKGYGNILNLDDLTKSFTAPADVGNQFVRNAIQNYNTAENLKTYNEDGTYSDAEKSRRRGERRAEEEAARIANWRGQDYANFSQEAAKDYLSKMAPTTRGYTGDYSDLDTFQNYLFSDPNFQYDDFRKIAEIAGYGAENQLASDMNIKSGAAEGTYRQEGDDPVSTDNTTTDPGDNTTNTTTDNTTTDGSTSANVWSAETYPVVTDIFSSIGVTVPTTIDSFPSLNVNNTISNIQDYQATENPSEMINFFESVANGTVAETHPNATVGGTPVTELFSNISDADKMAFQTRADLYKKLQKLSEEELEAAIRELTAWGDFLGSYGQAGTGGAAYGGAIKGYAMGGMGQAPDLPSGLLKSTEDGMADTIPAQMGNQPINLSGGEYIMDAETVAFLGNGNTDAGAQKLDDFRENLRMAKNGGEDQGNQINSENFLGRLQQMGVA